MTSAAADKAEIKRRLDSLEGYSKVQQLLLSGRGPGSDQ